jgi:hypothetical protein
MADRGLITPQSVDGDGLDPSWTSASTDGHKFSNARKTVVVVKNDATSAGSVTFQTPGTVDGVAIADQTISVPASDMLFWHGAVSIYNRQAGGDLDMVYLDIESGTTNLSIAVLEIDW